MFTGIIEAVGRVAAIERDPAGARIVVAPEVPWDDVRIGDSVAVNGVCLSVVECGDGRLAFEAVPETLSRTNLGDLSPSGRVNLERPLRAGARLDGHVVQGHVDGTAELVSLIPEGVGWRIRLLPPAALGRYIVEKGSIALDGISLTVARVEDPAFEVAIIPHTWKATNLSGRVPGERINVEVDILAKYVERLLTRGEA